MLVFVFQKLKKVEKSEKKKMLLTGIPSFLNSVFSKSSSLPQSL